MENAISALDDAMVAAFVDEVNALDAGISAQDVTDRLAVVKDNAGKLGHFALSFDAYIALFNNSSFMRIVRNTLQLGFITGFFSTLIGFIFAYVDMYTRTKFNGMFRVISVLPIVSPPFVLTLSAIMVFGKRGLITRHLLGMLNANIQGLHGLVMVQTMTFFPVTYLMLKGLLANIDPSLEESARDMGASRWKVFTTVTLPLLLPGLGNAFLVAFIEAVADFTNPVMIGGDYTTLAEHIYFQYSLQSDPRGPAAMSVVLLVITIILFMLEKYWLERKSVATLSGKASRMRQPITEKSVTVPLVTFCMLISVFVIGMYALIPLGGLFQQWGRKFNLVTTHFKTVLSMGMSPFRDALILSLIAAPITALLSMMIAYLVVKRKFVGKGLMEFVTMFAMAVPGTVLGIALLRGYITGLFGSGHLVLVGTGTIIVVAFVVRSLPIGTRSGVAALRQIDKSIEESAYDMGASSGKVFTSVTLPLIKDSFFSGLVTTFARSITATSAVIFLISARFNLITPQIMTVVDRGEYSVACAYATMMMVMVYGAIGIMNLCLSLFGTSRRQKRAEKKEALA
ncbi:MAG: iron ABC transporter permease [Clostridia bacterium]|nr:iron ABC transporter permease [Clostridia bacterium]